MRTSAILSRAQNTFHHNPRLRGPVSSSVNRQYSIRTPPLNTGYSLMEYTAGLKFRKIVYSTDENVIIIENIDKLQLIL